MSSNQLVQDLRFASSDTRKATFLQKARAFHDDKFDYTDVTYVNANTPVTIICPTHGPFQQTPWNHLKGGCSRCAAEARAVARRATVDVATVYAAAAQKGYELVDQPIKLKQVPLTTRVKLKCPSHNHAFSSTVKALISDARNCPKCKGFRISDSKTVAFQEFLERAKAVHSDKYSYNEATYKGLMQPMEIVCQQHGSFTQAPVHHLSNKGCVICNRTGSYLTTEVLQQQLKELYGDDATISFDNVVHDPDSRYITITCETHGDVRALKASVRRGRGCPKCYPKSRGEAILAYMLSKYKVSFIEQYKFEGCVHKAPLPFDFFLPDLNVCIEYQGPQHYRPVDAFGGVETFEKVQVRDKVKRDFCRAEGLKLIEISEDDDIETVIRGMLGYRNL